MQPKPKKQHRIPTQALIVIIVTDVIMMGVLSWILLPDFLPKAQSNALIVTYPGPEATTPVSSSVSPTATKAKPKSTPTKVAVKHPVKKPVVQSTVRPTVVPTQPPPPPGPFYIDNWPDNPPPLWVFENGIPNPACSPLDIHHINWVCSVTLINNNPFRVYWLEKNDIPGVYVYSSGESQAMGTIAPYSRTTFVVHNLICYRSNSDTYLGINTSRDQVDWSLGTNFGFLWHCP